MDSADDSSHFLSGTGVHLPKFLLEPQSLSSKKDREKRRLRYIPPAPRPHNVRSAPSQTRVIHSRLGFESPGDLNSSFQLMMSGGGGGLDSASIFKTTFEIQERLGFGSFGDVFRVKSRMDNKEYAVKKSRRVYAGEVDRARQLREVNRMIEIQPHPNIVEFETAWEEEGHLFFQMELCLRSLSQEIEEHNSLTEDQSWDVLIDIMQALQHLHHNRLVHNDVKPDNIFLSLETPAKYKIGDFGIIVSLDEPLNDNNTEEGDSRYLAPEVMQGRITTKADVFSLGLTILEISCNVDLPNGGVLWHQIRNGELPEPTNTLVPKSLESVIRCMLTPDVGSRPEITELLERPDVADRLRQRKLAFKKAWVFRHFHVIVRVFRSILSFVAWLLLLFKRRRQSCGQNASEDDSHTPPRRQAARDVPSIMVEDNSFSDDENFRPKSPVLASTPISHSSVNLNSAGGSSRLRGSRSHRLGNGVDNNDAIPVGSPTSRNLLKEFEAVSD